MKIEVTLVDRKPMLHLKPESMNDKDHLMDVYNRLLTMNVDAVKWMEPPTVVGPSVSMSLSVERLVRSSGR